MARIAANTARTGLTLVELLVVLIILAVLATVALRTTEGVVSEARFDATLETLGAVEDAILGPSNARQPDGSIIITGFAADVGRLPIPGEELEGANLRELWDPDLWASFPFAFRSAPSGDEDIELACGWRGPYIRLGVARSALRDGWGNAFVVSPPADAASGFEPLLFASNGANNVDEPEGEFVADPYARDLELEFDPFQTITVQVFRRFDDGAREPVDDKQINVRLFVPNPPPASPTTELRRIPGTIPSGSSTVTFRRGADTGAGEVEADILPGRRVVRARVPFSPGAGSGNRIATAYFTVLPAGTPTVELTVQADTVEQAAYEAGG